MLRTLTLLLAGTGFLAAQETPLKERIKAVRALEKEGGSAIPKLAAYMDDTAVEVRREAVRSIVNLGTLESLDPLTRALRDSDPEIQIRATDGLANFYLPGYIEQGLTAQLKHTGNVAGLKFNDKCGMAVDPGIVVRREVEEGLTQLLSSAGSLVVRANAARAAGALRAKTTLPRLIESLRSKDDALIFESVIAIQKLGDASAGHRLIFLLRDLNDRIQSAAIETVGLLRTKEALTDLTRLVESPPSQKTQRNALYSLAMLADPSSRPVFERFFSDKDENLRAAAAEGLGRTAVEGDRARFKQAFDAEKKMTPRLALAFAAVAAGELDTGELQPLRYLVNTINSKSWKTVALAYLEELARNLDVRIRLADSLNGATREERFGLLQVFGRSGGKELIPSLESLARDPDPQVAQESLRALRLIRAR